MCIRDRLWVVLHCQHVGSSFDYFVNVGVVKGKISLVFSGFQTCGKSEIVQAAVDFTLVKSRRDGYFAIYTQFRTCLLYTSKQFSLNNIRWADDSRSFTFDYNKRGHQEYIVYKVTGDNPKAQVLIGEKMPTFV